MSKSKLIGTYLALLSLGIATDFAVNGIAKIAWAWVYIAIYIGLAGTLFNSIYLSDFRRWARPWVATFLAGTLIGHLAFMKSASTREFKMKILNLTPVTVKADAYSEHLLLTSPKLSAVLTGQVGSELPVTLTFIKSYGCITEYKLTDVAGINFETDPDSTWVWRKTGDAGALLDDENSRFFWCGLHWF